MSTPSRARDDSLSMRAALTRSFFVAAGTLSLALGIAGIFLPLLPTTPFLLLASACYLRGSERMHRWLHSHPRLGGYLRAFEEGRGIPLRAKRTAVVLLWVSILVSAWIVNEPAVQVLLLVIATGTTIYIVRLPTLVPEKSE